MHNNEQYLLQKSKLFAIDCIRLSQAVSKNGKGFYLSKQLLRSCTSISIYLMEARLASSDKDLYSRLNHALREVYKSEYWLELLVATDYINHTDFDHLIASCHTLNHLLTYLCQTLKPLSREG